MSIRLGTHPQFPAYNLSAQFPELESVKAKRPTVLQTRSDISRLPQSPIMVVVAHPDDEQFCRNTLYQMGISGYPVQIVFATSGDQGNDVRDEKGNFIYKGSPLCPPKKMAHGEVMGRFRELEAVTALSPLHLDRAPLFLRYTDGEVSNPQTTQGIYQDLQAVIGKVKPRMVITFSNTGATGHPDHIQIGAITNFVVNEANKNTDPASKIGIYNMEFADESWFHFENKSRTGKARYPKPESWAEMAHHTTPAKNLDVRVPIPRDVVEIPFYASMGAYLSQFRPDEVDHWRRVMAKTGYEGFTIPKSETIEAPKGLALMA